MSGRYLLDTNIIIALFANESTVLDQLHTAEEVFIPCIAIGELYYGARKSVRVNENLQRIDEFVASNFVLICDSETARTYGDVKDELRKKGHPIPENDIWIGALAAQHDLVLVSRDLHFQEIAELNIESW